MLLLISLILIQVAVVTYIYLHSNARYERMQRSFKNDDFGAEWNAYFKFFDKPNYYKLWRRNHVIR